MARSRSRSGPAAASAVPAARRALRFWPVTANGSASKTTASTASASAAESTALGSRRSSRGSSSSEAGLYRIRFCRASHLKNPRTGTSRPCWPRKLSGAPSALR